MGWAPPFEIKLEVEAFDVDSKNCEKRLKTILFQLLPDITLSIEEIESPSEKFGDGTNKLDFCLESVEKLRNTAHELQKNQERYSKEEVADIFSVYSKRIIEHLRYICGDKVIEYLNFRRKIKF